MKLLASVLLLFGLALPAQAAILWADDSGSGSSCSQSSPCTLSTLVAELSAGDTGMVNPGSYGALVISNKGGTAGNPITLKAVNPAVDCADPVNDPDGCEINTQNRSIIGSDLDITGTNADYWVIEGFELNTASLECLSSSLTSGPDHVTVRFIHINNHQNDNASAIQCADFLIEHSYITQTGGDPGNYGLAVQWAQRFTARNMFIGGNWNHNISLKRYSTDITLERIVCAGNTSECIVIGQEADDTVTVSGGTSCPGVPLNGGGTGTVYDNTFNNVTIRNVFAASSLIDGVSYWMRYGLRFINGRNVDVQNYFASPSSFATFSTGLRHDYTTPGTNNGACGLEPGNNVIRGFVSVGGVSHCMTLQGSGFVPSTLTIENFVCHAPDGGADRGANFASGVTNDNNHVESTAQPTTTIRNSVFNDCSSAFSGAGANFTQSHNNVFNCGSSPGGTGAQTVDPQFTGPESDDITITTNLSDGERLWDWAGDYQPIIDRFKTNNPALVGTGVGSDPPCEDACDQGANEFFVPFEGGGGGPGVWASCAVYGNGDEVFGDYTDPWIDGRTGLVIDVDCSQKRIVIGRCGDPTDEETCDTDIYIHKAAQLRKQRTNEPITLSAGTTGSDQDTSGACWRTRATFDFTESLEELTGIWVRYEVDPDGGTHDCSATEPPQFAWQGAE